MSTNFKSVKLLRESVRLYHVNDDGTVTEKTNFGFTYDETTYQMTLVIPDNEHLRLEYIYELPTDVETSLSNKVCLEGRGDQKSTLNVKEAKAGGSAQNDQLLINKVDAANQTQGLAGVAFKLTVYDQDTGSWDDTNAKTYTTNAAGQIELTTADGDIEPDRLYRLEETKELDGYQKNDTKYYFIWRSATDLNAQTAWRKATGADDAGQTGLTDADRSSVRVFPAGTSQELTVLNARKLSVKKIWWDKDGQETNAVRVSSVTLALKQYTGSQKDPDSDQTVKTIELNAVNNWTWTYTNAATDGFTIDPNAHYYIVEETPGEDAPYEFVEYSVTNDKGVQQGGLLTVTNRLKDNGSYELPSTGGSGTARYTAAGILLMGAALVIPLLRKKKSI